jgi:alpha-glucosidase
MKKHTLSLLIVLLSLAAITTSAKNKSYILQSPDKQLKVEVTNETSLSFAVYDAKGTVLAPSEIALNLTNGEQWGIGDKVKKAETSSVKNTIPSPFYKKASVQEEYNQLRLLFSDFVVVFRAYNDGVAYRFESLRKASFVIASEKASYNFSKDHSLYAPYVRPREKGKSVAFEKQFFNSFENVYTHAPISSFDVDSLMFLPLMVELEQGRKLLITEANLENYPGMYLNHPEGKINLTGVHALYPKKEEQGGHNMLQMLVPERENFIAKVDGPRTFPWRVFGISQKDTEILTSDLVYKLADPSRVNDISWIKPGKVAWDWWNAWNISGVDFEAGINNDTYKYYIDFAAREGIEYVILDEGWAVNKKADMLDIIPEIDLPEIVNYAADKGVGIILWAGYYAFARDMENICRHYQQMGVKGFKIDFMDRDDQLMTNFIYKASETCARYKMMADFHGMYKPTGLQRTYPNVVNNEGVYGLEQMKWSEENQVLYDVTFPFIRMYAGPVDYTQGAMRNAIKKNFRPIYTEPMSPGTRCRQLAQYVIFESPLNMLCDNPTNYMKEPLCTNFIAKIPTVWDETVALSGEVAKYIVVARRSGNDWYIGGMTDWDKRAVEVDLSFLPAGTYNVEFFVDGINADKVAMDYKYGEAPFKSGEKLTVHMAPGGGFAAKLRLVK